MLPGVGAPLVPSGNVQCPAVTTIVGLTSVPVQLNQPPGSVNRGSVAVGSKNSSWPTYGWAPASGTPFLIASAGAATASMATTAASTVRILNRIRISLVWRCRSLAPQDGDGPGADR